MRFLIKERMIGIRISEVKMYKSDTTTKAKVAHRQVQSSTTLNRRYVKRPVRSDDVTVTVKRSPKIQHFGSTVPEVAPTTQVTDPIAQAKPHPVQVAANERMKVRVNAASMRGTAGLVSGSASGASGLVSGMTAKQMKDQAIQKALAAASQTNDSDKKSSKYQKIGKVHFGWGRVLLAFTCAAVAVVAIVYFVNLNMPDISLRVAAMNTGIEATYPSYVPRDFALTDITSENGKITLNFKNSAMEQEFTLVEEKSSWDSNALLSNYVKAEYTDNFATIREQGLTIYVDGSNAAWVNGGVVYKLSANGDVLTKKQIKSIATSL